MSTTYLDKKFAKLQEEVRELNHEIISYYISGDQDHSQSGYRSGVASRFASIDSTIADIQSDIATNVSDITANEECCDDAQDKITIIQSDIATNVSDITAIQSDIATNVSDITANEDDIATNVSDITAIQSDIATNVSDITANEECCDDAQDKIAMIERMDQANMLLPRRLL